MKRILIEIVAAIIIGGLLLGAYMYWTVSTAEHAKLFCASVNMGNAIEQLKNKAEADNIKWQLKTDQQGNELFVFTRSPNRESRCLVEVKNGIIIKKHHWLTL